MTPAETAKLLIGLGFLMIFGSFIFAVANMTGLIGGKKTLRRRGDPFYRDFKELDSSFKRHGLAMIGFVIGIALLWVAVFVGGIDMVKEILGQFGIHFL